MKKKASILSGILLLIILYFFKSFVFSFIYGDIDPTEWEVKLMVNKIVEAIESTEFERYMQDEYTFDEETDDNQPVKDADTEETAPNEKADNEEEIQTKESDKHETVEAKPVEKEYVEDNSYNFLMSFEHVNLYKNKKFADAVGLNMNVFNNKLLKELTNIKITVELGDKDARGDFIDRYFSLDISYSKPKRKASGKKSSLLRVNESGSLISFINYSERIGILEYYIDDMVPEYKRIFNKIISSIEKYKVANNGDLSGLKDVISSGMEPGSHLTYELEYDYYVSCCDIWEYPISAKYKFEFDNENGKGNGTDGKYLIKIEIEIMDNEDETTETFTGVYSSTTKTWTEDFKD